MPAAPVTSPATHGRARLCRAAAAMPPAAPVRIVHLGIGNFARAHQAVYTHRAPDAAAWGIAAFTGRRAAIADALVPQDGLYTLVTRDAGGDGFEVIASLSAVHPASEHATWRRYLADPRVAVVTCTVTEAGYRRAADGSLDTADPVVAADIAALRSDPAAPVQSAPARLAAGLYGRRSSGAGRVAVVPCDNIPGNGAVLARVVRELAGAVGPGMAAAVDGGASFVTTMVDRITPATTDADRAAVTAATGWYDSAPVVTEPFTEWVIGGEFPGGHPDWAAGGARFVADVEPFERRKLWLLNGSHSLLAYCASVVGHRTISGAVADPICAGWVAQWWDEAARHLAQPAAEIAAYRAQLLRRYANPRIEHRLAQIAADGSQKLPVRVVPVLRAELADGRVPIGGCRVLAGWVCHLRGLGVPVRDADRYIALAAGPLDAAVPRVLAALDPALHRQEALVDEIITLVNALATQAVRR